MTDEPRRWPLAHLDARTDRVWTDTYAKRLGVHVQTVRRFLCRINADKGGLLTTKEADEMAHAAGLHPMFVWSDWLEPPFHGCDNDDLWSASEGA